MDDVKRWTIGASNGVAVACTEEFKECIDAEEAKTVFVLGSDFDAALAREAALREELTEVSEANRLLVAWREDSAKEALSADEQRNADLETAIRHTLDDSSEDAQTGEITIMRLDYETLSALIGEQADGWIK